MVVQTADPARAERSCPAAADCAAGGLARNLSLSTFASEPDRIRARSVRRRTPVLVGAPDRCRPGRRTGQHHRVRQPASWRPQLVARGPQAELDQAETVQDLVGWAQLSSGRLSELRLRRHPATAVRADVAVLPRSRRPDGANQPAAGLPARCRDPPRCWPTGWPGPTALCRRSWLGRWRNRSAWTSGARERCRISSIAVLGVEGFQTRVLPGVHRPGPAGGAGQDRLDTAGRPGGRGADSGSGASRDRAQGRMRCP